MVDRIRQLMEHLGQNSSQFADRIDVPRAVLSHIMSGRNKPSLDVIIKLLAKNEKVSPDWLLHGKGEMLISVAEKTAAERQPEKREPAPGKDKASTDGISGNTAIVQNGNKPEVPLPVPPMPGKKVKQVILVYTDNTFAVLSPEQ